jgi:hypothetical protein
MIRVLFLAVIVLLLLFTFLSLEEGMIEREKVVPLYEEIHNRIKGNQISLSEIEKQIDRLRE